jgi:hypothetical protein
MTYTNKNVSRVTEIGKVEFPSFLAERIYMREFRLETGLPSDLSRWQETVNQMLVGVDTDGPIYLMVDQGVVRANASHRRPGAHIDGYWIAAKGRHGGGGGHAGKWQNPSPGWSQCDFSAPEALILASDVSASRALIGEFYEMPGEGGDCSMMDLSQLSEVRLLAGVAYAGNVTMIHESLPVPMDTARTLVRLSVPGWEPCQ